MLIVLAEVGDERLGGGDLAGRRRLLIEVADQADADAVLVDVVGAGVAAMDALLLVVPPLGDLDLAVAAAVAVADDEVVAAAVVAEELAVLAVDLVVVARCRGAVVQDDVAPGTVGLVGIEELVAPEPAIYGSSRAASPVPAPGCTLWPARPASRASGRLTFQVDPVPSGFVFGACKSGPELGRAGTGAGGDDGGLALLRCVDE